MALFWTRALVLLHMWEITNTRRTLFSVDQPFFVHLLEKEKLHGIHMFF